jgi:hypothetical protein
MYDSLSEDDIQILGLPREQITKEIEREYVMQRQMYHARGGQIMPVSQVVTLLRMCGYEPAFKKPEAQQADWMQVKFMCPVLAEVEGKEYVGEFLGVMGAGGPLAVRIGGVVKELNRSKVTPLLGDAPQTALTELDEAQGQQETAEIIADTEPDRKDPEGKVKAPVVNVNWLNYTASDPVEVKYKNRWKSGRFCFEGPGDGELTVFVDGVEDPIEIEETKVRAPKAVS